MLYLKEANNEDLKKEFEFIRNIPKNDNGFTNPDYNCTEQDFRNIILPSYINNSKGRGLPDGWVPMTTFFLWHEDEIVGIFRLRHHLNEYLINGSGHIGYYIRTEYRNNGYATKGLELTLQKAFSLIKEKYIYMSANKDNIASLKVQLKNNAIIHHEDEQRVYTRIYKDLMN